MWPGIGLFLAYYFSTLGKQLLNINILAQTHPLKSMLKINKSDKKCLNTMFLYLYYILNLEIRSYTVERELINFEHEHAHR